MKPYEYKLYVVTWGDAWSTAVRYYDEDDDYTPLVVTNVGWLCEDNDETIVLATSFAESGALRGVMVIPHADIISIEELV